MTPLCEPIIRKEVKPPIKNELNIPRKATVASKGTTINHLGGVVQKEKKIVRRVTKNNLSNGLAIRKSCNFFGQFCQKMNKNFVRRPAEKNFVCEYPYHAPSDD